MNNVKMMLGALALAPALLSCAAEPGDDGAIGQPDTTAEDVTLAEDVSSLCILPPTPPAADASWVLSDSDTVRAAYVDPDNGECDAYVVNARHVEDLEVTVVDSASSPESCVGTSLTVRRYFKNSSGTWTADGASTALGVWTINGCRLPKLTWNAHTTSDARVHITSKRQYGSPYSLLLRGLPIVVRATNYYLPPPN